MRSKELGLLGHTLTVAWERLPSLPPVLTARSGPTPTDHKTLGNLDLGSRDSQCPGSWRSKSPVMVMLRRLFRRFKENIAG